MGRKCSCPGCRHKSGLHSFPADLDIRRQWIRALGLQDRNLPPNPKLCNRHFSRDCFSNLVEVDLGVCKLTRLKPDAVPCVALPELSGGQSQLQRPLPATPLQIPPKRTRVIGCQTNPTRTKHAFAQADLKPKPIRRRKATQARIHNRNVSCDTCIFMAVPEVPRATSNKAKRRRCEVSTDDSRDQLEGTNSTMNCTSTSNEVPAPTVSRFILHPEDLMELFTKCPICSQSCDISKTVVETLLHVKQSCAHCKYFHQWSSQPTSENAPAENLQLCAAVLFPG